MPVSSGRNAAFGCIEGVRFHIKYSGNTLWLAVFLCNLGDRVDPRCGFFFYKRKNNPLQNETIYEKGLIL
jgi:hypothetical protein